MQRPLHARLRPTAWPRAGLALLVAAVVLLQTLGLMHRVAHAERSGASAGTVAAAPSVSTGGVTVATFAVAAPHGAHWLDRLFAGHGTGHDCDAYDQSAHADLAVGVAPMVIDHAPAEAALPHHAAWQLALQAAGALARGPPANA